MKLFILEESFYTVGHHKFGQRATKKVAIDIDSKEIYSMQGVCGMETKSHSVDFSSSDYGSGLKIWSNNALNGWTFERNATDSDLARYHELTAEARAKAEAEQKAKAEAEQKAKAEAEAEAKKKAEAKAKAEANSAPLQKELDTLKAEYIALFNGLDDDFIKATYFGEIMDEMRAVAARFNQEVAKMDFNRYLVGAKIKHARRIFGEKRLERIEELEHALGME